MLHLLYFKYQKNQLDGYPLMQRFTLIHDGSSQGWQATYLAFHFAAQLGAPLLVLLSDTTADKHTLKQRAAQVEVGARAAGVVIETRLGQDFTIDVIAGNAADGDGLFISRRLVPDGETATRFLQALSRPMWVISRESEDHKMAVLLSDPQLEGELLRYTTTLSRRMQQSLIGIVQEERFGHLSNEEAGLSLKPIPALSPPEINAALRQLEIDLLFISASKVSLIEELSINYAIYPISGEHQDA